MDKEKPSSENLPSRSEIAKWRTISDTELLKKGVAEYEISSRGREELALSKGEKWKIAVKHLSEEIDVALAQEKKEKLEILTGEALKLGDPILALSAVVGIQEPKVHDGYLEQIALMAMNFSNFSWFNARGVAIEGFIETTVQRINDPIKRREIFLKADKEWGHLTLPPSLEKYKTRFRKLADEAVS